MPPEHLLKHYFTGYDIAFIKAGGWSDPAALGALIQTDPLYPFEWKSEAPINSHINTEK